ncbi:MAG: hypothetical protein SRB1_01793 [Desulfobacteraceae bacterium Eth-SRB1]|nr:MAG: hypothetical protein SRB1_01793 [Desulfobacteraceae bacterium Eth-SRB1]
MRILDKKFIAEFKKGGLFHSIIEYVINDTSLDFEIRDGYSNIYFKGNSILKLNENGTYNIHKKFLKGMTSSKFTFLSVTDVNNYLNIPTIKNSYTPIEQSSIVWYWVFVIRYWFYGVSHLILYLFTHRNIKTRKIPFNQYQIPNTRYSLIGF